MEPTVTEATPVTVMEAEVKVDSVSVMETPVTEGTGPELLQTDSPSNGIDASQPLFAQPEPETIIERIMAEERHLQGLNAEGMMPGMAEEPAEIMPGLQAKQYAEAKEAKEAAKLEEVDCIPEMQEKCHKHHTHTMGVKFKPGKYVLVKAGETSVEKFNYPALILTADDSADGIEKNINFFKYPRKEGQHFRRQDVQNTADKADIVKKLQPPWEVSVSKSRVSLVFNELQGKLEP